MALTPYNILRHEFIGLRVEVVKAGCDDYLCAGKVLAETQKTFTIESDNKRKKIPKKGSVFEFILPSKARVRLEGVLLLSRPEDRIKKKHRIIFA
ncbi:MAG: hypothetical protein B6U97_05120 [Candidatus Altiarchaeales archaeon ex4484_96]|nr:MAG: hypothetical protein B6U97_05120 [Candidatus Altiarchaeales archaeon ex4484_96]